MSATLPDDNLPIFPLKAVLLPGSRMVLRLFEDRYLKMLEETMAAGKPFGVVMCADHYRERETMAAVGCLAHVRDYTPYEDGTWLLKIEGGERFRVGAVDEVAKPYLQAQAQPIAEDDDMHLDAPVFRSLRELLEIYRALLAEIDPDMVPEMFTTRSDVDITFLVVDQMVLPESMRQELLETVSVKARCEKCLVLMRKEIETLRFLLADEDDEPFMRLN